MNIFIGEHDSESVNIEIKARLYPNASDYYDGNYLKVEVIFELPGLKGSFLTNLRTTELRIFYDGLKKVHKTMRSECVLANIDEYIIINGKPDYTGTINWDCILTFPSGHGAVLKFKLNTSFMIIDKLIISIKNILEAWPIIGE